MLLCKTNRSRTEDIHSDSGSRDVYGAIQTHSTSLKLVMTHNLRKNNTNLVLLPDFHSQDVKVLYGGAH